VERSSYYDRRPALVSSQTTVGATAGLRILSGFGPYISFAATHGPDDRGCSPLEAVARRAQISCGAAVEQCSQDFGTWSARCSRTGQKVHEAWSAIDRRSDPHVRSSLAWQNGSLAGSYRTSYQRTASKS
jgi:hypothetical protein